MVHMDPTALLPLPPATFHILLALAHGDRHGDELAAVFAMRRPPVRGPLAALATAAAAVADVVPNALAAHWDLLVHDLRWTARSLRRAPGFALTAIIVVALGVGANTAAFSVA